MAWTTLVSTFGLLFISELGDKTQLAIITQVCKHRRPWYVFLGGALALAAVTGLGVAFGRLLGAVVPALLMRRVAAAAFVVMGLAILYDVTRKRADDVGDACACPSGEIEADAGRRQNWLAFSSTFGLLFVAELGDKTQLATLSIATKTDSPWPVFIGAAMALTVVTGLGALFGQGLCRLVPERVLKLVSSLAFITMGVLTWFGVL